MRLTRRVFLRSLAVVSASLLPAYQFARRLVAPVLSASVTETSVILSWTDAGDETGYIVYRGNDPMNLVPIAMLPANVLTYTDVP